VVQGWWQYYGAFYATVMLRLFQHIDRALERWARRKFKALHGRTRDYSAWLGLVPKQMSTGDRTILGHISKRGNGYLRTLFIQAARVILVRPANWPKHGFGAWLVRAAQRLHPNVLAVALANKLARIAWTVLAQERSYEARVMK
jgi:transposase